MCSRRQVSSTTLLVTLVTRTTVTTHGHHCPALLLPRRAERLGNIGMVDFKSVTSTVMYSEGS